MALTWDRGASVATSPYAVETPPITTAGRDGYLIWGEPGLSYIVPGNIIYNGLAAEA